MFPPPLRFGSSRPITSSDLLLFFVVLSICAGFCFCAVVTHAQQGPPFVPYSIDEAKHKELLAILGEVPAKYANPLIVGFMRLEQEAQAGAHRRNASPEKGGPPHPPLHGPASGSPQR